jgi:hypothetical protein
MTIYTGKFSNQVDGQNSPFFDGDENYIESRASGSLNLVLQYTAAGQINSTNSFGTAQVSAGAYAVGEQDVDVDGFADYGNGGLTNIAGGLGTGVSFNWSFGSAGGTGSFSGSINAAGTSITGTATISDQGLTITAPMTLTGSGASASVQQFRAQIAQALSGTKGFVTFASIAVKLYNAAISSGLDLPSFLSELRDPTLQQQLGIAGKLLAGAATYLNVTNEADNGDWAGAIADLGVFYTKLSLSQDLNAVIIGSAAAIETGAGAVTLAAGVAAKAATLIFDKQLTNVLRTDYLVLLNAAGVPGSAPQTQAAQQTVINFPPGYSPNTFDPGYYLSNHPDAVSAVASGAYASAYDYYLAIGINRGDRPSAGTAPIDPSDVPDLAAQVAAMGPYSPEYGGVFELAPGSMPTDGLSTTERTVGDAIFSGPAAPVTTVAADGTLSALANRYAIDLARNQQLSGDGADFFGSMDLSLSNGDSLATLESAAAPGYANFSVYVHSALPGESLADVEASLQQDMAAAPPGATQGYGIAEFAGVWVVVVADPSSSGQVQAAPNESSSPANFYGTGNDTIFAGWHSLNIDGGPGNNTVVFNDTSTNYTITTNNDGSETVADNTSGGPIDRLTNVANLQFGLEQNFAITDNTSGMSFEDAGTLYSGPVSGLSNQFVYTSTDNLNVTAQTPNSFIHTGSGFDAIDVSHVGGTNVLDGGTNSNFLVGGTGTGSNDTFFVDDRGPSSDIWSTVADFHAGDAATIFGITQQGFNTSWVDGQGATGYTGLTLHVTAPGVPTASLTLAGFSTADLSNGRISTTWGTEADGTPYLYVHDNS